MQQILGVWESLDPKKRIIVVVATVMMFAAILGVSSLASRPTMVLLYSGLEADAAGEVVQALEQRGVDYDVKAGSIFVPSGLRDELRLTLASDGLPANSAKGYELLDALSGFGTTSQMFDAAYWRAKEGELARTITANQQFRTARVHIANPSSQPFRRQMRSTASVTVTANSGTVSGAQSKALQYLIASAVAGLAPEDVSIIDGRSGTVVSGNEGAGLPSESGDREEVLRQSVQNLLEARVGYGNAVVEVSLDTATDHEQITERTFDPSSRVAISSETEERTNSSTDTRPGDVTVASNLPNGAAAGGGDSSANTSETRERINYEVSEVTREVIRAPGTIKRMTVAVLVNGLPSVDADTGETVWAPRPEEELQALQALVSSAVGLDVARGDEITIRSMQFEILPQEGEAVQSSFLNSLHLDVMSLIQLAVLAIVALALGMFVVRPILSKPPLAAALPPPPRDGATADAMGAGVSGANGNLPAAISGPTAQDSGAPSLPALTGEIDDGSFGAPQMNMVADFDLDSDDFGGSSDPVKRLKHLIEERQEETVEILRSWMEDKERA
ncbi:Flagellar M-ring protein [Aquimixticola soesokkakensis]|uniref:Flagellar M-ring protein n=1 Tax=Aquimixticola soesokkakensis TaxID=1519096 RepID=A0A1Y5RCU7_9RHOB|nr:flagellar basal-body MS-ring/collar protein FliF [Aquimixticola soesokkakensis]SLN13234.1 Flagellar M-ring protein [Aquimixticola soesokkakensis]